MNEEKKTLESIQHNNENLLRSELHTLNVYGHYNKNKSILDKWRFFPKKKNQIYEHFHLGKKRFVVMYFFLCNFTFIQTIK